MHVSVTVCDALSDISSVWVTPNGTCLDRQDLWSLGVNKGIFHGGVVADLKKIGPRLGLRNPDCK